MCAQTPADVDGVERRRGIAEHDGVRRVHYER
jgi:hypothetical protein